jgi:hypothetical protein
MIRALPSRTLLPPAVNLAAAGLALWAGLRAAPGLSTLDQFHLLTSLTYLLLLLSFSAFSTALNALRARPRAALSTPLVLLLGYALPGLVGWLPLFVLGRPIRLADPDLLWVPATQAAALTLLTSHMPPLPPASAGKRRANPAAALLGGVALALAFTYLWQLARTPWPALLAPGGGLSGVQWGLALFAAPLLAYHGERALPPTGLPLQALLRGALTFRPLAFLPAMIAYGLFAWLARQEGRAQPAALAHLAFNCSAVILHSPFIH